MRVQGERGESWARPIDAHQVLRACRDHARRKHVILKMTDRDVEIIPDMQEYGAQSLAVLASFRPIHAGPPYFTQ